MRGRKRDIFVGGEDEEWTFFVLEDLGRKFLIFLRMFDERVRFVRNETRSFL